MPDLKGTKTHDNLKLAFAADAQLNDALRYYARIAEIEGYAEVAGLLKRFAESGLDYAHGHLDFLKTVGDPRTDLPIGATEHNVASLIEVQGWDANEDLPAMARTAHAEGFPDIANWFETLAVAKEDRVERLKRALSEEVEG
jgi:rubrerythrin